MSGQSQSATLERSVGVRDHLQGPQTALVTLVEYGDYECSQCGQAHVFVHEARQRFGDRLRFVFRHFVMTGVHAHAQHAAEAAEAAGGQGRFWEMHDTLFTHQEALDNGFLVEYADALGLDVNRFLRDMAGHVHVDRVREDLQSGMHSGVARTPTFFLNGVRCGPEWDAKALLETIAEAVASREADAVPPSAVKRDVLSRRLARSRG
ncbi:MAG TPA: thioredoxin domain-containing protein [Ktedonobacterales bacterium]|nr:thioredoxin domain-containing protein [Ktedonobacterales bacterium]